MRFRFVVILRGGTFLVSKKYVGDYRLENVPDRRGKLKTVPVYRGPLFRFTADEKTLKAAKGRCLALTVLLSAALLVTLVLHSELLQRIYVVMPLVLSILPTALIWAGVYHLFTAGPALPRDKSDKIHNRFAGWSILLLALSALSLLGQALEYFCACREVARTELREKSKMYMTCSVLTGLTIVLLLLLL